jgi:hypothetical protein
MAATTGRGWLRTDDFSDRFAGFHAAVNTNEMATRRYTIAGLTEPVF